MKQKVVVIGHGYAVRLGIIRSLCCIDCDITVIALTTHKWLGRLLRFEGGKPIDCYSKYIRNYYHCLSTEKDLIQVLLTHCIDEGQKAILIPDSDFSAATIDRNQGRLQEHFLFPHIHHMPGTVEQWMHKTEQKKLAADIGLNVTRDCIVRMEGVHYSMPQGVRYPCFTKPLATISGGKQFLKRCDNEAELRKVLDAAGQNFPNTEVLLEDFKAIDTEYAVVGFSDGNNVVIPGVIEFVVNSQSHFGVAREGKIMPVTGFEDLLEQFKMFVRRVGFYGLFDIDFYKSEGKMYFGEMNLRFGGSGYAYTAMGANLPAMLVRSLRGENYSDLVQDIDKTATYVNERMCIDDWSFYHISEKEMREKIDSADIKFVYDDNDKGPQRKLNRYIEQQRIKRKLRKWLK